MASTGTATLEVCRAHSPLKLATANTGTFHYQDDNKSGEKEAVKARIDAEFSESHADHHWTLANDVARDQALENLLGTIPLEWQEPACCLKGEDKWGQELPFGDWANRCAASSGQNNPAQKVYHKPTAMATDTTPGGSPGQKPDLALFRPEFRSELSSEASLGAVSWHKVACTGEINYRAGQIKRDHDGTPKSNSRPSDSTELAPPASNALPSSQQLSSASARKRAKDQVSGAACQLFYSQPHRQYYIHFTVNNSELRIWIFNRSGRFLLGLWNLETDRRKCQWIFYRLPRLDPDKLGFINSLAPLEEPFTPLQYDDFDGQMTEVLFRARTLASRATRTYLVKGTYAGEPFEGVMKAAWIDMRRQFTEVQALKIVREKGGHSALVSQPAEPPINRLLTYRTTWLVGNDDAVCRFQEQHPRFVARELSVMFLCPAAKPIQHYASVIHLLKAFRDTIDAHEWLSNVAGILHRDISISNLMLQVGTGTKGTKGLLIDLDLSIPLPDLQRAVANHRTGTYPFIAMDLLEEDNTVRHIPRHDLESFVYVLIWICTLYGAPAEDINSNLNLEPRTSPAPRAKKANLKISDWQGATALECKSALGNPAGWNRVKSQTDSFWEPLVLKDGLLDGLAAIFDPIWSGKGAASVTHEAILEVMDKGLEDLEAK